MRPVAGEAEVFRRSTPYGWRLLRRVREVPRVYEVTIGQGRVLGLVVYLATRNRVEWTQGRGMMRAPTIKRALELMGDHDGGLRADSWRNACAQMDQRCDEVLHKLLEGGTASEIKFLGGATDGRRKLGDVSG